MNTKKYRIVLFAFIFLTATYLVVHIYHYAYLIKAWEAIPNTNEGNIGKLIIFSCCWMAAIASFILAVFHRKILSLSICVIPFVVCILLLATGITSSNSVLTSGLNSGDKFSFTFAIVDIVFISIIFLVLLAHITLLIYSLVQKKQSSNPSA